MWRGFAYQLGKQSVADESRGPNLHYLAFISYSHRDDVAAQSLHKRLETYRLPSKLVGQETPRGAIPDKLTPIFRDLDELSAADNLSTVITEALAKSDTLIVLASPGAKASRWVNLEIESFRTLHGDTRPVLVALIEGEPDEAFPAALTADGHEPVAADFRGDRGARRLALLKLVAGMTGAGLDQLVQRDAQRQNRRVMAVTFGAIIAVLVMALLLAAALRAQTEAERQRQAAEGLVEYMLTDLRDKLKGVGRLDVMTAVNQRAMDYYGGQVALEGLSDESLDRRARILHAMGEDDQARGDLSLALKKFEEARRVTAAVLAKKPNDPDAIFAHAQSEFWVGSIARERKQSTVATQSLKKYKILSDQLVSFDPKNIKWLKESAYAQTALCTVEIENSNDNQLALNTCKEALKVKIKIRDLSKKDNNIDFDVANGYAWLADAYLKSDDINNSIKNREIQFQIESSLINKDKKNVEYIDQITGTNLSLFDLYWKIGKKSDALLHIKMAKNNAENLYSIEKKNLTYNDYKKKIALRYNKIEKDFSNVN